jgi:hypothetical protein
MNFDDDIDALLAHAAGRAASGPAPLIASLIEDWSRGFERDPAEALGVRQRILSEMALCRRPRAESWLADASEIAADVGIETGQLVAFLRAAETVERLRSSPSAEDGQTGRLLAARDRDEDD